MDDTTWEQGKLVGGIAAALAALKWIVGRSRTASTEDKCDAIKKALEEHESKMNTALREIRLDIQDMRSHQERADELASDQRTKVNRALDEMGSAIVSFKNAVNSILSDQPEPPTRRLR